MWKCSSASCVGENNYLRVGKYLVTLKRMQHMQNFFSWFSIPIEKLPFVDQVTLFCEWLCYYWYSCLKSFRNNRKDQHREQRAEVLLPSFNFLSCLYNSQSVDFILVFYYLWSILSIVLKIPHLLNFQNKIFTINCLKFLCFFSIKTFYLIIFC